MDRRPRQNGIKHTGQPELAALGAAHQMPNFSVCWERMQSYFDTAPVMRQDEGDGY
ncbi:hypothetical protein J6524_07705 [Bradyrhizobium sp. WSM 1738]|uniref:hypothetical protein n=1 Tax=Bradyrhizobium hereditatis TaxID=2821405 RepID=UPI001CE29644|nr:hypothetical protein [Bradyrhizobium hereditatis]MCA6114805.1 hypothetical protein [Bradyrhizobium hereditatis]